MELPRGKEITAQLWPREGTVSEEMALLADLASTFAEREVAPHLEGLEAGQVEALKKLERGLIESGLLALTFPEERGGAGASTIDAARCIHAVSHTCAGVGTLLAGHLAAAVAGSWSKAPADVLWSLATTGSVSTQKKGKGTTAEGTVRAVPGAAIASVLVVPTKEGQWVAVETDAPGVTVQPWDQALGLGAAALADVSLCDAKAHVLKGAETDPFAAFFTLLAAACLGLAADAIERALDYAGERYQGGKIIINHAAIQDMIAEPAGAVWAARALVHSRGGKDGHSAKIFSAMAVRAAVKAADSAVQVHGGYGYMADYRVESLLRDARTLETALVAPERALREWLQNAAFGA